MNKKVVLVLAALLIGIGLLKPNLSSWGPSNGNSVITDVVVVKPKDKDLLEKCDSVITSLKSGPSSRKEDGKKLAQLFSDMATLVSLDGEDQVIKNTEDIRQANKLVGAMLKLDLKGKYPDLKEATTNLVKSAIGDDLVLLDAATREKAAEAFNALAWASNEGSK
jgi:hypothetical protein